MVYEIAHQSVQQLTAARAPSPGGGAQIPARTDPTPRIQNSAVPRDPQETRSELEREGPAFSLSHRLLHQLDGSHSFRPGKPSSRLLGSGTNLELKPSSQAAQDRNTQAQRNGARRLRGSQSYLEGGKRFAHAQLGPSESLTSAHTKDGHCGSACVFRLLEPAKKQYFDSANQHRDQLRPVSCILCLLVFKTHAAFSIQKGRLSFIFFKGILVFPQLFFF